MQGLQQKKNKLQAESADQGTYLYLLLEELSRSIPDNISLAASVIYQEDSLYTLTLDGNVRVRDFSPEIILASYVDVLEKSPFFQNVVVTTHNKRQEPIENNLSFQLKMEAVI